MAPTRELKAPQFPTSSPTLAHLGTHGEGLFASRASAACQHSLPFTFAALGLDDDVEFPSMSLPTDLGWRHAKLNASGLAPSEDQEARPKKPVNCF
jgi:hypothetical protein